MPEDESCWCITRVVAHGFYKDGIEPAVTPDVIVEFFGHNPAGIPTVDPDWSHTATPISAYAGKFDVPINEEIVLEAGTHWLSFRPKLDAGNGLLHPRSRYGLHDDHALRDLRRHRWQGVQLMRAYGWTLGVALGFVLAAVAPGCGDRGANDCCHLGATDEDFGECPAGYSCTPIENVYTNGHWPPSTEIIGVCF